MSNRNKKNETKNSYCKNEAMKSKHEKAKKIFYYNASQRKQQKRELDEELEKCLETF